MDKNQLELVLDFIDDELEYAMCIHGPHNSHSEAYAVILEEVQEAEEEVVNINSLMDDYWDCIRDDDYEDLEDTKLQIFEGCIRGIEELIQVAAMVKKNIVPRK